ncbi:MAG: alpha-glucosidase/alpha-galactosidase [Anaerolineae bacterium]|nr:alpha-glucosidase/alpha-galactosidase [Anaerolineae bacterium]
MKTPKIVMIGVGSHAFGLMTLRDMMQEPVLKGTDLVLVDINAKTLDRMVRLAARLNVTYEAEFKITATTDRCEALPGANIVVTAVEQKHYETWTQDILVPVKHGTPLLYGENGGPGGAFHTFRQVPLLMGIARNMERFCPDAWLVNYSNPESRLCLAINKYTSIKSVGVCLGAYITQHNLATKVLGLTQKDIDIKVAGINHCHWVLDIRDAKTGEDLYPAVREKIDHIDPKWEPLSRECLKRFGYYPGPADSHVGEYISWAHQFFEEGYNDWVMRADEGAAERTAEMERLSWGEGPLADAELKSLMIEGGLRWQTIDIIAALLDGSNRYVLSLNVPNEGHITNLRDGGIIEIPAIIGADKIYGLHMGELPPAIATLMETQLYVMDLVIDAAVTGDRQTALEALSVDPLMPSPAIAAKIFDDMIKIQAALLPQFQ